MASKSCLLSGICCPSVAGHVSSGDAPTCPLLRHDHWSGFSRLASSAVRVADGEEEGQNFSFCPSATLTMKTSGALMVDTWAWRPSCPEISSSCLWQEGRPRSTGGGGSEGVHPYVAVSEVAAVGEESQSFDGDNVSGDSIFSVGKI